MKSSLVSKLCLGTAQFGLDYGVANKKGKIPEKDAFDILDYAYEYGIGMVDTAYVYGESEAIIGRYCKERGRELNIISKLSGLEHFGAKEIRERFKASLERLKTERLYGYLIHHFEDLKNDWGIWDVMEALRGEGLVSKIGLSLYQPEDLKLVLDRGIGFDIIQLPYSVFDRRFEPYFDDMKNKGIEIHIRSVFLQGLAFLGITDLKGKLLKAKSGLMRLQEVSRWNGVSKSSLCLNFALSNRYADRVIMGIDNIDQLKSNILEMRTVTDIYSMKRELEGLAITDEDILLPHNWGAK